MSDSVTEDAVFPSPADRILLYLQSLKIKIEMLLQFYVLILLTWSIQQNNNTCMAQLFVKLQLIGEQAGRQPITSVL